MPLVTGDGFEALAEQALRYNHATAGGWLAVIRFYMDFFY
jgi:hypothetical protein